MSWLQGILGGAIGAEGISLIKENLDKHGGVDGVLAEFEKSGLGEKAKSWVSTNPNLPISSEDIQKALGSEKVREMAAKVGISTDAVADLLAKHLPTAVDKATPDGKLPTNSA
jgi:uncharacterized protein YidB (DUF937 family)